MTDIKKLISDAEKKLICSDAPNVDAYEIAKLCFGIGKTDIITSPLREIGDKELGYFNECVEKRRSGYPLQYIIGEWDFYGHTFYVGEGVLVPRPETEQIAEKVCCVLKNKKNAVVFDLCTGSGCIGLSIAADNPYCNVFLTDISEEALSYAKRNRDRLGLDNIEILSYDIFSGFDKNRLPKPDVIVCNPPYVTENEFEKHKSELMYEPKLAIVCKNDGLDFYRCLADKWLPFINANGYFMFECGEGQSERILEIIGNSLSEKNRKYKAQTIDDIYGVSRFVSGIIE